MSWTSSTCVVEHHAITMEVSKRTGNSVLVSVGFEPPDLLVRHQAVSDHKSVSKLLVLKEMVGPSGRFSNFSAGGGIGASVVRKLL